MLHPKSWLIDQRSGLVHHETPCCFVASHSLLPATPCCCYRAGNSCLGHLSKMQEEIARLQVESGMGMRKTKEETEEQTEEQLEESWSQATTIGAPRVQAIIGAEPNVQAILDNRDENKVESAGSDDDDEPWVCCPLCSKRHHGAPSWCSSCVDETTLDETEQDGEATSDPAPVLSGVATSDDPAPVLLVAARPFIWNEETEACLNCRCRRCICPPGQFESEESEQNEGEESEQESDSASAASCSDWLHCVARCPLQQWSLEVAAIRHAELCPARRLCGKDQVPYLLQTLARLDALQKNAEGLQTLARKRLEVTANLQIKLSEELAHIFGMQKQPLMVAMAEEECARSPKRKRSISPIRTE